jgi:hypothetical protein
MIFLNIGDLVSLSSSLFSRQARGQTAPSPSNDRSARSRLLAKLGRQAVRSVVSLAPLAAQDVCSYAGRRLIMVSACLGGPRFRRSCDRFVTQLFFGSNPVLDIFPVVAAALKIQIMRKASDLFSRWFSASKHGNLLGCLGVGRPTSTYEMWDYLPFAETLIFTCFGLDSSRLAICRLKTPLRYSARMLSKLTVFGREKLRVNEP